MPLPRKPPQTSAPSASCGPDALRLWADRYLTGDGPTGATGRPTAHGRPVEIHLTAPVETVLELSDVTGELPGCGPVPASVIRELARDAALRLLTIDEFGRLVDYGRTTYRAPADLAAVVKARYPLSAAPGCDTTAIRVDLDHQTPYGDGGPTDETNIVPLTRRWHRAKTLGDFRYAIDPTTGDARWVTPLGQQATKSPYDYRLGP